MASKLSAKSGTSPAKKGGAKSSTKKARTKSSAEKGAAKKRTKSSSGTADPAIYIDPGLRERLKKKIMEGDRGGKPGQWSARKAQLLAQEYEKAGGGYKAGAKKGARQKSLEKWTEEEWQTSDEKKAERSGGTTRYLPKKAWEKMTPAERRATNKKKQEGSRQGAQHVANTAAARKARRFVTKSTGK